MGFPTTRLRRLRRTSTLRAMVRETSLRPGNLIMPIFAAAGGDVDQPLPQIPGMRLLSGAPLAAEARELASLGLPAVLLFGVAPRQLRTPHAEAAWAEDGPTQQAVRQIKQAAPGLTVITDLCLCEYTDHGHCGIWHDGTIDNDRTLAAIQQVALSHARAGADVIAPSGMMDGVVRALRQALDANGFEQLLTMPYSAKFASKLYGPFKSATASVPGESQHATHQLDPGNARQAMREIELDIEEGADLIIVKPALTALDIIHQARARFPVPIAAYQVSGTFNMLYQAAANQAERDALMLEVLTCIRRAGADLIITYYAKQAACQLGRRENSSA